MNVIRTQVVELETAPMLAYKFKLKSGGSGIKLINVETGEIISGSICKRSGQVTNVLARNKKAASEVETVNAFAEAVEKTIGLPYSSRGKVNAARQTNKAVCEAEEKMDLREIEDTPDLVCMENSAVYKAVIEKFTSKKTGKFDCSLMNKDFMNFAAGNGLVRDMAAAKESIDDIVRHVVWRRGNDIAGLAKNEELTLRETESLMASLDSIYTKGVFKTLRGYIKRMQR